MELLKQRGKKDLSSIGIDLFIQLLTALLSNKSMTIDCFVGLCFRLLNTLLVDSLFIKNIF